MKFCSSSSLNVVMSWSFFVFTFRYVSSWLTASWITCIMQFMISVSSLQIIFFWLKSWLRWHCNVQLLNALSAVTISNWCARFYFFNILRTYSARFSLLCWFFSSLKTKSISVYFHSASIKYAVMPRNARWFELLHSLSAMKTLICVSSSASTSF